MTWYRWDGTDLYLQLHVQPRARRDELVGPHGDALRVRITAPPVEGRANTHLRRFLAASFGVPARQVELLSGETGRSKRVRIEAPRQIPPALAEALTGSSSARD